MRAWAADKVRTLLGLYMVWQGIAVLLFGDGRLLSPSNQGLREFADILNAAPRYVVLVMFAPPGAMMLSKWTHKVGLLLATLTFALFAVGNLRAMFANPDATIMAPNTYTFLAILAAWLFMAERYTT
jgi:hypothetical protein